MREEGREGGREEGREGAFAAFISIVLASALLQNLEPSHSLSLFSSLLSSLFAYPSLFFWLAIDIYVFIYI